MRFSGGSLAWHISSWCSSLICRRLSSWAVVCFISCWRCSNLEEEGSWDTGLVWPWHISFWAPTSWTTQRHLSAELIPCFPKGKGSEAPGLDISSCLKTVKSWTVKYAMLDLKKNSPKTIFWSYINVWDRYSWPWLDTRSMWTTCKTLCLPSSGAYTTLQRRLWLFLQLRTSMGLICQLLICLWPE